MSDMTLWSLTGWLFLALLIVSVAGEFFQYSLPMGKRKMFANINDRIKAWWVIAIILIIAVALGKPGVMALFVFISFASLREFLTLTNTRIADSAALAAAFFIVLPMQYLAVGMDWYGIQTVFIPVYAFLAMPIISALSGESHSFLIRVAETQWSLMVCVFCISHVPALMMLDIPGFEGRGALLILFLVIVVQSSDTVQYICGVTFGKRRIAPELSPSKTVEGLLVGLFAAAMIGALLFWITPFTWWQAALMAVVTAGMGFFGSLVMAAIKRDRGIQEWGPLMMAQGGFTDRLDTVIFSAPVFFHLTRFFWVTWGAGGG